jgi:hypothetical protein
MNDEPIAEPMEPSTLTSAPVVATSAGDETTATIDFKPGEITWVKALVKKISTSIGAISVPKIAGRIRHRSAWTTNPMARTRRLGAVSARVPPCKPKRSAAR